MPARLQAASSLTLAYHQAALAQGLAVTLVEDSHNNHFSLLDELAVADSPLSLALLRMIGAWSRSQNLVEHPSQGAPTQTVQ